MHLNTVHQFHITYVVLEFSHAVASALLAQKTTTKMMFMLLAENLIYLIEIPCSSQPIYAKRMRDAQ